MSFVPSPSDCTVKGATKGTKKGTKGTKEALFREPRGLRVSLGVTSKLIRVEQQNPSTLQLIL